MKMFHKIIFLLVVVCFMSNYSKRDESRDYNPESRTGHPADATSVNIDQNRLHVYTGADAQEHLKLFGKEYKYIHSLKGFYKLHMERKIWIRAHEKCLSDGTVLLRPDNLEKMLEIINVLEFFNGTQPSKPMVNSLKSVLSKGHATIDGIPLSELYNHFRPNEYEDYPFICKKSQDAVEWNIECNVPVSGYIYNETIGKCYKFHVNHRSWYDAYDVCKQEESYLAIINSKEEQKFLAKLTERTPKDNIMGDYISGIAHLGFRKDENNVWMTIDGTKLEDSGFALWNCCPLQPDGPARGVEETCGSMFYNGELNDIGCQIRSFFICEHDISSFSSLNL